MLSASRDVDADVRACDVRHCIVVVLDVFVVGRDSDAELASDPAVRHEEAWKGEGDEDEGESSFHGWSPTDEYSPALATRQALETFFQKSSSFIFLSSD